jgi:hypothetical protein
MNKTNNMFVAATVTAAVVSAAATVAAAPSTNGGVNVTVNGEVVTFRGSSPRSGSGPCSCRCAASFERLGASVQYEPSTKTILALKGPTTVRLRLGEAQADVNGEIRTLSVPAQAEQGTTLVPLRFVSEALGAQVKWQAASRTVVITTSAQQAAELPEPPGSGPVTGTLTGVFPEANAISVRVPGGQNTRVLLATDVVIWPAAATARPRRPTCKPCEPATR